MMNSNCIETSKLTFENFCYSNYECDRFGIADSGKQLRVSLAKLKEGKGTKMDSRAAYRTREEYEVQLALENRQINLKLVIHSATLLDSDIVERAQQRIIKP